MLRSLKSKFIALGSLGLAVAVILPDANVQSIKDAPESCARDGDGRLLSTNDGKNYAFMNRLILVEAKGGELKVNSDGQLDSAYPGEMIENKDLIEDKVWDIGRSRSLFNLKSFKFLNSVDVCTGGEGPSIRFTGSLPKEAIVKPQGPNPTAF